MSEHTAEDMIVYIDETSGEEFAVSLTDILRCVRIAEERFMVPATLPNNSNSTTR
jgi:hypothetical protein